MIITEHNRGTCGIIWASVANGLKTYIYDAGEMCPVDNVRRKDESVVLICGNKTHEYADGYTGGIVFIEGYDVDLLPTEMTMPELLLSDTLDYYPTDPISAAQLKAYGSNADDADVIVGYYSTDNFNTIRYLKRCSIEGIDLRHGTYMRHGELVEMVVSQYTLAQIGLHGGLALTVSENALENAPDIYDYVIGGNINTPRGLGKVLKISDCGGIITVRLVILGKQTTYDLEAFCIEELDGMN